MASGATIVIPSSSPQCIFARSPTPVAYNSDRLFGTSPRTSSSPSSNPSSSPSMLSPSLLFLTPRSRKNKSLENKKAPLTEDTGREDIFAESVTGKRPVGRLNRVSKKCMEKQGTLLGKQELVPGFQTQDWEEVMEIKKRGKPQKQNKSLKQGNKMLIGKVAKLKDGANRAPAKQADTPRSRDTKSSENWDGDDLQLEKATERRLDWTPRRCSETLAIRLDEDDEIDGTGGKHHIVDLYSEYAFSGNVSPLDDNRKHIDGGPTKRRKLELLESWTLNHSRNRQVPHNEISLVDSTNETSSMRRSKQTRPGKKMNTITAYATAQYVSSGDSPNKIHEYVNTNGNKKATNANPKPMKVKRNNSDNKRPPKKSIPSKSLVVSPEAASRTFSNQAILFGTCSQLERDESPALRRETQMAIRVSESPISTEQNSDLLRNSTSTPSNRALARFVGSRSLWSVGARDSDGSMALPDVLEMIHSPDISRILSKSHEQVSCGTNTKQGGQEEKWIEIDDSPRKDIEVDILTSTTEKSPTDAQPPPLSDSRPCGSSEQPTIPPGMPRFNGFTDVDLRKQVAAYGFKPIKDRDEMVMLLQNCWENRHSGKANTGHSVNSQTSVMPQENSIEPSVPRLATGSLPGSPSNRKEKDEVVAERRGRRKKDPSSLSRAQSRAKTVAADEHVLIPPSQSASLCLCLSPISSATQLNSTTPDFAAADASGDTDGLPDISTKITRAVRSQPQTRSANSSRQLTWHEKILLYNPISLEDFTVWLNTKGLGSVGEDGEISAGFVREWCESKGICCY